MEVGTTNTFGRSRKTFALALDFARKIQAQYPNKNISMHEVTKAGISFDIIGADDLREKLIGQYRSI